MLPRQSLRILALEPYLGGSHAAFLADLGEFSRHRWTVEGLPAYQWKWRMRHAPLAFARRLAGVDPASFDGMFCSDMLDLAAFRGLLGPRWCRLPVVAYFHENQLTYPDPARQERDHHFAFTNFTTAVAADEVWFNSAFHRDEWRDATARFLARMPDHPPLAELETVIAKSRIEPPGVRSFRPLRDPQSPARPEPPRILWVARFEGDKNPELFFAALRQLKAGGHAFRLSVIGAEFQRRPGVFASAQEEFASELDHFGYQPDRADFERVLRQSDVVVSTAQHEFFGLAVLEAVLAGAFPLLPARLAYPEVYAAAAELGLSIFHADTAPALAERLAVLLRDVRSVPVQRSLKELRMRLEGCYAWETRAPAMDQALEELVPAR